jgi:hypothetical protein
MSNDLNEGGGLWYLTSLSTKLWTIIDIWCKKRGEFNFFLFPFDRQFYTMIRGFARQMANTILLSSPHS